MTIGGWILWGIISAIFVFAGFGLTYTNTFSYKKGAIGALIGVIISIVILIGFRWYYSSTASGARALKSQESNFNRGMKRSVRVYDMNGNLIQQYQGKFDVTYDDNKILFDDENNLRHIIYYPTGTVIIDEIGK